MISGGKSSLHFEELSAGCFFVLRIIGRIICAASLRKCR